MSIAQSFRLDGMRALVTGASKGLGRDAALAMTGKLRVFTNATSLGGCESLIEHRASVEGPNPRSPQNLLRISIGLEHADDLIADLAQALG